MTTERYDTDRNTDRDTNRGGDREHAEHTHAATVHTHEHYHVTHVRSKGPGLFFQWDHQEFAHTHEHNHSPLTHSHDDYGQEDEAGRHDERDHVHDHASPAESPA